MGQAILFGVLSSGALVIGGAIGAMAGPGALTGVLLAFASGLMISALSFDLFQEAYDLGGIGRAGIGLIVAPRLSW